MSATSLDIDSSDILRAMLALMVDEREARLVEQPTRIRTELVLSQAGLPATAIAALLNKQPGTVQMALYRAKTKNNGGRQKTEASGA